MSWEEQRRAEFWPPRAIYCVIRVPIPDAAYG